MLRPLFGRQSTSTKQQHSDDEYNTAAVFHRICAVASDNSSQIVKDKCSLLYLSAVIIPLTRCQNPRGESSVRFSTVQDGIYALGKANMRSAPSPPGHCNIKEAERERVQFGSVQFKVVTMRSEKAHMRCTLSQPGHFNIKEGERREFSSVQFKMVSMRSENPICAPHSLSEFSPNVAFETVPRVER